MANRPDKYPRWADQDVVDGTTGNNNVIEPSEAKKNQGWDYLEPPSRNWWNWLHRKIYEWIAYFDDPALNPFAATAQSPSSMSVDIGAGKLWDGETLTEVSAQTIGPISAPTTDNRIDRVVIDRNSGIAELVAGTESATPSAPAIPEFKIPNSRILLVPSMTEIENADITDERALTPDKLHDRYNWSYITQVGPSFDATGIASFAVCALNKTDVVIVGFSSQIRTYRFDGSGFTLVGTGLTIASWGSGGAAALNGTDVAVADVNNDTLTTYRFNGSTWSVVGSSLSLANSSAYHITALNSTDVCLHSNIVTETLRIFRFNGSTWSQVGNHLNIPFSSAETSITAINETDVAVISASTINAIKTYRFDGTNFSLVGTGLTINGLGRLSITQLNRTDFAVVDDTTDIYRVLRFYQDVWSEVFQCKVESSIGTTRIVSMNKIEIASLGNSDTTLRMYRFGLYFGSEPINQRIVE